MSRVISFRDLMLCTSLSHIKNEVELLNIENDVLVAEILDKVGFDVDYPVLYVPSKHRDMQNKIAVGFMAVGEISLNRAFTSSYLCSATERLIAACHIDPSLTIELGRLAGSHVNYKSMLEDESEFDGDELPEEMLEPDRYAVAQQIKQLTELRDLIRGDFRNESGDLKTFEEYKNV
jgi:hypothetical protein